MDEFLTYDYTPVYGASLKKARHLKEDEKKKYLKPYWDTLYIGMEDNIHLKYIGWQDNPDRQADGSFPGCGNSAWIISQEEWDHYLELEAERAEKHRTEELENNIKLLKERIARMEGCELCQTKEEAREKAKQYNDLYNEGGYGYVPYFYTVDEYKSAIHR